MYLLWCSCIVSLHTKLVDGFDTYLLKWVKKTTAEFGCHSLFGLSICLCHEMMTPGVDSDNGIGVMHITEPEVEQAYLLVSLVAFLWCLFFFLLFTLITAIRT